MNTRKIAVIVLSVMALALMTAAIAIAIQLANNQAPTDTAACDPGTVPSGTKNPGELCLANNPCTGDNERHSDLCVSGVCDPNTNVCLPTPTPSLGCRALGCACTDDSGCTSGFCERSAPRICSFPPTTCGGSGSSPACTSSKSPGDACLSNAICTNSGARDSSSGQLICGCVVQSTPTPTSGGSNPTPTSGGGNPTPTSGGNNPTPTQAIVAHSCGQHCNQGTGLCQTGFTCAFDNSTCQTNGIYNNTTYCVPNSVYSGLPTCASQYNNTDKYIVNAGGSVTEAYILSLCPAGTTGTPLPTDAQGNIIPATAVVSDKLDPILLGLLLVIFGVSLYPRIKFRKPGRSL